MIGAIAAYWWVRPLLRTGTGYAAHNACALDSIAHRTPLTADLPPNPLVPYLHVDADSGGYRATVLGLLASQHAWAGEGFGCTLAVSRPSFGAATRIDAALNPILTQPVPAANVRLDRAVAHAFGDDLDRAGRDTLGTRAIVVLKNGRIVSERYAPGFTAGTPQLGWSMAKSVTSLMLGRMVAQGTFALSDDHLRPEWTDDRARITIEDLLRMRSGLAWDETYDLGTPITEMLYNSSDMAGFVASQKLVHPVGSVQQYSSGSTTFLCAVLNATLHQGADLPRRQLLAELGIASAIWEADATGNTGLQFIPVGDPQGLGGDRSVRAGRRGLERHPQAAGGVDEGDHHKPSDRHPGGSQLRRRLVDEPDPRGCAGRELLAQGHLLGQWS